MKMYVPCSSIILLSLIFFISEIHCMVDDTIPTGVVDYQGNPTPPIINLLKDLGIVLPNTQLSTVVEITQKLWLRPAKKERWQVEEKYSNKRKEILKALNNIGCINTIHASKNHYDAVTLLGGTYTRMQERLDYMLQELEHVTCDEIVFLIGQRPLDSDVEKAALSLGLKTESDALRYLVDQARSHKKFSEIKKIYIDVPMIELADGKIRRPTTGDTFKAWLDTNPHISSCLLISSQPYVGYQQAVAKTYVPSYWNIETIGNQVQDTISNADYLDNMARWLYQENMLRAKKSN